MSCGVQYQAVLDPSAPAEVMAHVRPAHLELIGLALADPRLEQGEIGANRVKDGRRNEQRRAARYRVAVPFAAIPVDTALTEIGPAILGMTRDLSTSGLCLLTTQRVDAGLLLVKLWVPKGEPWLLLMRVVECQYVHPFHEIRGPLLLRLNG